MGGQGRFYMEGLQAFLQDEAKKYGKTEAFSYLLDVASWELVGTQVSHKSPQPVIVFCVLTFHVCLLTLRLRRPSRITV